MKRSSIKKLFPLLIVLLLFLILLSCNSRTSVEPPENNISTYIDSCSSFKDKIPYSALGSGKIVFERISSYTNYKSCTYVIDANKQHVFNIPNAASQCCISPDGKYIAFSAYTNLKYHNDIYIVNTDGFNGKRISNFESWEKFPSWSPDGKYVYFWCNAKSTNHINIYKKSITADLNDIYLIKTIYNSFDPSGRLSVSKNKKIAFAVNNANDPSENGLYIIDETNPVLHHIIKNNTIDSLYFDSPIFSISGESIYYLKITREHSHNGKLGCYKAIEIYQTNIDGTNIQKIKKLISSGCQEVRNNGYNYKTNDTYLALSPDGKKLLLNIYEGNLLSHIYALNINGSNLTQITSKQGITDHCISWGR